MLKDALGSMIVGLAAALCACAASLPHEGADAPSSPLLHEADGRFALDHPFTDFYDTAFVLTNAGATPPRLVNLDQLADLLIGYDVVFYGETHTHSGIHVQQMQLLRALYARDPRWILSLEQFERDVQAVVDEYLAGRIGENTLIDKGRAWNNYTSAYRPLMLFARDHHLPVVAAEAPDWSITCIGRFGPEVLTRFTPQERSWEAADLHVTPGAYREKFSAFMGGSETHGGKADAPDAARQTERSFAAQVARDDTMAESIERARRAHPGYRVLALNGSFHSAGFLGTVERLKLRDPQLKIAVIDPIEVEDPARPAFAAKDAKEGTVLELIYPTPDEFVDGEDTSAWMAKMIHERTSSRCPYAPPAAKAPQ